MEGTSEGKTREQGSRVRDANRFVALECLAGGLDNKSVWKYMGNLGAVVYIQDLNSSTLLSLTSHDRVQSEENLSEFYQLHKDD